MSENATDRAPVFWAKADRSDPERVRIHPLECHLADVGACFEAILKQPTIKRRVASAGGLPELDAAIAARLTVFAALHDIGKVNIGFQTRIWRDERKPGWTAGHTADIIPVLTGKDRDASDWFLDALGWDDFCEWDDNGGETACGLFAAAMSHHGEPLNLDDRRQAYPRIWRPYGGLNPEAQVRRVGNLIRRWFPDAFRSDAPKLPAKPAFQHMFLGLCTLADWIGSNEDYFPYYKEGRDAPIDRYMESARERAAKAVLDVGLDIREQRAAFRDKPDFAALFDHPAPNAIQTAAIEKIPLDEPLAVIESETGSGKTEAALWRFSRMYAARRVDSLYFALPTRAAAVQIHGRVKTFAKRMFADAGAPPDVVLAVPGYLRDEDAERANLLHDYNAWWERREKQPAETPWAARSAKRYLAAQIAVGSVDQAMMAALQVRHSHMRAACLSRSLLAIDEVHASDPYMRAIIEDLLAAHLGAGGYAMLMSATLGSSARRRWLSPNPRRFRADSDGFSMDDAIAAPYPSVATRGADGETVQCAGSNERSKTVRAEARPLMGDFAAVAARALSAAERGAKVLIIRNTVGHAIDTHRALRDAGVRTILHHSRYAAPDRRLLDGEVEKALGNAPRADGGIVVVGTQTLEQSLDIDADLLITDLCPMDVLLQRIGRLHRHPANDDARPEGFREAKSVILTPPFADLTPLLSQDGPKLNGLGTRGFVYPDLRVSELTRRLIAESADKGGGVWEIPKMNRELVERTTHPQALSAFDGMDEWAELRQEVEGAKFADGLTARSAVVKRDRSFLEREVVFASGVEDRIRTRLGEDDVEVEFAPPLSSPFNGAKIAVVTIPLRWLDKDNPLPESPIAPQTAADGGFEFAIGDRRFRYDRLGLRRV